MHQVEGGVVSLEEPCNRRAFVALKLENNSLVLNICFKSVRFYKFQNLCMLLKSSTYRLAYRLLRR